MFLNLRNCLLVFIFAVCCCAAFLFFFPIWPPEGIYTSSFFECLHDGNVGMCVLTSKNIFYAMSFEEEENQFDVLGTGQWEKIENGNVKVEFKTKDNNSNSIVFVMKIYLWGGKINTVDGFGNPEIVYAYRKIGFDSLFCILGCLAP